MSKGALNQDTSIEPIARHQTDTGSPENQVSTITNRIRHLTEHFKEHKGDLHSKRGLQLLVSKRKKLLKYLKRKNNESYFKLINHLGLRDSY